MNGEAGVYPSWDGAEAVYQLADAMYHNMAEEHRANRPTGGYWCWPLCSPAMNDFAVALMMGEESRIRYQMSINERYMPTGGAE